MGYKIGNSTSDELKASIDKFIDFAEQNGEKIKEMLMEFINTTEDMSSDEIKANIEKIVTNATKKIEK